MQPDDHQVRLTMNSRPVNIARQFLWTLRCVALDNRSRLLIGLLRLVVADQNTVAATVAVDGHTLATSFPAAHVDFFYRFDCGVGWDVGCIADRMADPSLRLRLHVDLLHPVNICAGTFPVR